jgi:hypothetical protein
VRRCIVLLQQPAARHETGTTKVRRRVIGTVFCHVCPCTTMLTRSLAHSHIPAPMFTRSFVSAAEKAAATFGASGGGLSGADGSGGSLSGAVAAEFESSDFSAAVSRYRPLLAHVFTQFADISPPPVSLAESRSQRRPGAGIADGVNPMMRCVVPTTSLSTACVVSRVRRAAHLFVTAACERVVCPHNVCEL